MEKHILESFEDISKILEAILKAKDITLSYADGKAVFLTDQEKKLVEIAMQYAMVQISEYEDRMAMLEKEANELQQCDSCGEKVARSELLPINIAEDPDSVYQREVCARCYSNLTKI